MLAETFLSPAEAGSRTLYELANPRLKAGVYGSYAGFADGFRLPVSIDAAFA